MFFLFDFNKALKRQFWTVFGVFLLFSFLVAFKYRPL